MLVSFKLKAFMSDSKWKTQPGASSSWKFLSSHLNSMVKLHGVDQGRGEGSGQGCRKMFCDAWELLSVISSVQRHSFINGIRFVQPNPCQSKVKLRPLIWGLGS